MPEPKAATTANAPGHREERLGRSPFGTAAPSVVMAMLYAVAALVWVVAGSALLGGRWLALHLFTLGVATNLVLVFSDHFGHTLTRTTAQPIPWQTPVVNVGILLVLFGLPSNTRWATAVGATVVTVVVTASWLRLRRMRNHAIGARFVWIVRTYERAHGAFIHGAILGLLMGVGALRGAWYAAGRTAHLHVNVLGWAGLTLLATLVFFGPTMVRTRIVAGADERAAVALRHGATGLTVAVVLLLATGFGGPAATPLRVAAAAAMAVYAWAVTVVCLPVATAAWQAKPSAPRWPVVAVCSWFPVIAWSDVAVVATGGWRWLDAIGLAMVLGVLGQAITAALIYLTPMLRAHTFGPRDQVRLRLEKGATARARAFNVGTAAVVAGALLRNAAGSVFSRGGWALIAVSLLWTLAAGAFRSPLGGRPAA